MIMINSNKTQKFLGAKYNSDRSSYQLIVYNVEFKA